MAVVSEDRELPGKPGQGHAAETHMPQQYVRFSFYKVDPAWRRLTAEEREAQRQAAASVIGRAQDKMLLETYSVVGTRGDCDFLVWQASEHVDDFYDFAGELNRTAFAGYLSLPYSYLSVTRESMYVKAHLHPDDGDRRIVRMGARPYLIVYPFVKTRPWYKLTRGARQGMMIEHVRVGHTYPHIRNHTTYSYGLDDQEFVVAFDCDEPRDFLELMMELRTSEVSAYTLRDTPSFTCRRMPVDECLSLIG